MATLDQVIADLRSDDSERYVRACENLDRMAERRDLPRLYKLLLEGENFAIREAAAWPIARLDAVRAVRPLLEAMRHGTDEGYDNDTLTSIICDLVEQNPSGSAPVLCELVMSPRAGDREDAAWLWGFAAAALSVEPLLAAARDADPEVRAAAMGSLDCFRNRSEARDTLLAGLQDPHPSVRAAAVSGLTYWKEAQALSAITALADDPDPNVRRMVAYAQRQLADDNGT